MERKNGIRLSFRLCLALNYPIIFLGLILILAASCKKDKITSKVPEIETEIVSSFAKTTAISGGNISSNGGADITERGVCWGTGLNPDISTGSRTSDGTGTGEFTSSITGLLPNTTYHVRAYACNEAGTGYGNDISFNTTPGLTTLQATLITADSVVCGGNIGSDGTALIVERGVCWSEDTKPELSYNKKISDSTGTGTFLCRIKNLDPSTTYYLRAYAINPAGTSYGNLVIFTTKANPPTVSTNWANNITATEAISGGSSYSDARAPIIVQGVCWGTVPGPTTDLDTKSINGNTPGTYTSTIWGLSPKTKYYYRAYATNSEGTGYGYEYSFTTTSYPPTLTTTAISSITTTSASSGGNITSDGGSNVTTRGICWSSSPNPTTYNYRTYNGTGTGAYTSSISGLSSGTTYYVRAFATNSGGTAYGNEISFTTSAKSPTLTTTVSGSITISDANSGENISND